MDAFVISSLPSRLKETLQTERPLCSADVTPHPAHTDPSATLSSSIDFPVEPVIHLPCSGDFFPGRGGLLQLLGMSLSPCCRFHPAEVMVPCRSDFAPHAAFTLRLRARPSEPFIFEATSTFTVVTARSFVISPKEISSIGFRILVFPPPCYPNYGAPDCCPGRSTSC